MAKNDNMLSILWMLNSGSKITAGQIAEKLELNIRTVYRYIDALCASGIPIISEALDDLCIHWFFHHHLMERSLNEAVFSMEEQSMLTHLPYFLLPYGKSIQVIEPQSLKQKLVSLASELLKYYQS